MTFFFLIRLLLFQVCTYSLKNLREIVASEYRDEAIFIK